MGTPTTNYGLYKPAIDEQDWGEEVNTSTDVVDAQMKLNADAAAAAAAAGVAHAASDGTSHSHVALNDTHRTNEDAINGIVKCNGAGTYSAVTDSSAAWNGAAAHKTTEDAINGIVKVNGAGTYSAVTDNSTNWDGAASHKTTEDAINGIVKVNGAGSYSAVTDNSTNWDSAYSHVSSNGSSHSDVAANTAARHTQNTDTGTTGTKFTVESDAADAGQLYLGQDNAGVNLDNSAGFKNNGGTMQFKNKAGSWTDVGSGGASATRSTFTNASLSSGVLTVTHSMALSAPYPLDITIFDNNYQKIMPDNVTGATNSVAIDLTSYGTLTGTWAYVYIA